MKFTYWKLFVVVAISLALHFAFVGAVFAGPWHLGANILVSEEYLGGERGGVSQQGQFVTQLSPGVNIKKQGARIGVQGRYSYNQRISSGSRAVNRANHTMRSSANVELVRKRLFMNGSSSYQRRITDPLGFLPVSSTIAENQNDVWTNAFGARLVNRFSRFAQNKANYNYSTSKQIGGIRGRSQRQSLSVNLSNGPAFGRLSWGLSYRGSQSGVVGLTERSSQSALANIGYRFSRSWSAVFTAGYEINPTLRNANNDASLGGTAQTRLRGTVQTLTVNWVPSRKWSFSAMYGKRSFGETYNYRANWLPTVRTSISGSYGRGPFGENYQGSLSHKKRKSVWRVIYTESYSSRSYIEAEERLAIVPAQNGDVFFDANTGEISLTPGVGNAFLIPFTVGVLVDDLFVRKLLSANVSFTGRKTNVSFLGRYERRIFDRLAIIDRFYVVGSTATRQLNEKSSLFVSLRANRNYNGTPVQRDTVWTLTTGYNHRLGKRANLSLQYRLLKRDSTSTAQTQQNYMIRAQFRMSFGR